MASSEYVLEVACSLIKKFEGFSARPYLCPAGIPTIGYGFTRVGGIQVTLAHPPITREQADLILRKIVRDEFMKKVMTLAPNLSELRSAAVISFAFNLGLGALRSSTMLKRLREEDYSAAAIECLRWNKAGGKIITGLKKRRIIESKIIESGALGS